jgi:prepilin-type N-terminal cleavage/methylation domain-containing protein
MRSPVFPRNRSQRGGLSLVEMLVVIALSSLVFGIAISLMLSMQKFDRHRVTNNSSNEQLLRLADTLRADIRAGSDVRLADEKSLVVRMPSGEQIRYEIKSDGCRRAMVTPDASQLHADLFAIGKATQWNVEQTKSGRSPLVAVTLEQRVHKNQPTSPKLMPFLVCAALGADTADSVEQAEQKN